MNEKNIYLEAYKRKLKQKKDKKIAKMFAEACFKRFIVNKYIGEENKKSFKNLKKIIGIDLWHIK